MLGLALISSLASCKHENEPVTPVPTPEQPQQRPGKVYPVGAPLGSAVTTSIGPAGGTLTSADKRLTITVPAGAVETAQSFGIQSISSSGPQSLGPGFRLSPHGTTFKKPVTISVNYEPATLSGTVAEALALAYQNDKGVWVLAAKGKVDTTTHAVSVETTHFSDWALLQRAKLTPEIGFVQPGGDLGLEVIVLDDQVFVPIPTDTEIPAPYQSPTQLVDDSSWKLAGSGTLTPAIWKAQYRAPSTMPARNPIAVSIKLNGPTVIDGKTFKELWLVSTIYVGNEGITFRVNNGPWINALTPMGGRLLAKDGIQMVTMNGGVTTADGNNWGVTLLTPQPLVEMEENSVMTLNTMTMPWSLDASPLFFLTDQKSDVYYQHFFRLSPSPGALTYYRFGKVGDYFIGKFELQQAGISNKTVSHFGTARVEGFFRVKRAQ